MERPTGMTNPVSVLESILIEHTILVVLPPILIVHGIFAYELQLPKTVVPVIRSRGAIDDELLPVWTGELLWAFV